jgi:hypothetical protein
VSSSWLIRIPEVFADHAPEILAGLGAVPTKTLGSRAFAAWGGRLWELPRRHAALGF